MTIAAGKKRVMVTLDGETLAQLDELAARRHQHRGHLIEDVLRRYLSFGIGTTAVGDPDPAGVRGSLADIISSPEAFRSMLGPIEDMRRRGVLDAAGRLASSLDGVSNLAEKLQKRYRLPALGETAGFLQSSEDLGIWKTLDWSRDHADTLQRAASLLTAPWLDTDDVSRSVSGFCGLQGIGHQLRLPTAFDPSVADRLRLVLGDWRDRVDWPDPIFVDPLARSDFYRARGLDPVLTGFPAEAFDQITTSAGLKGAPPPLLSDYCYETDSNHEDEETGFARTNAAHDRLQRFETYIRSFIERKMRGALGDNWIKQRVSHDIWRDWREKQQKARGNGEPDRPLIAYADFTHYEKIIVGKKNWEEIFAPTFKRPTMVQESFQRLYPIRICTMHARPITQDDELYLYVETKRLLDAIGIAL